MTYRITLLPRAIGPFAEKEDLLSGVQVTLVDDEGPKS